MILASHLELVWWRMRWKFVNAQVIKVYAFDFFSRYIQLLLDLDKLDKKGFRATGIMRKDRAMKSPLIDIEQMKRNKESHMTTEVIEK